MVNHRGQTLLVRCVVRSSDAQLVLHRTHTLAVMTLASILIEESAPPTHLLALDKVHSVMVDSVDGSDLGGLQRICCKVGMNKLGIGASLHDRRTPYTVALSTLEVVVALPDQVLCCENSHH